MNLHVRGLTNLYRQAAVPRCMLGESESSECSEPLYSAHIIWCIKGSTSQMGQSTLRLNVIWCEDQVPISQMNDSST